MAVSCGSAGDGWRNEAFNLSVIDAIGANIAVLDRKGLIMAVNNQWEQFAADNGDFTGGVRTGVGVNYLEVIRNARGDSLEGCAEALKGLRKILKGRSATFDLEYPCHSPDQQRWFLLRATLLQGPDRGAVVTHFNITERRQAEEALRQSEERFRVALKNSPISVFTHDRDLRYTWMFNPSPKFGNTSEQILGKTDAELIGKEKAVELTQIKHSVLKRGLGTRREIKILLEEGTLHFDLKVEPRRDEAGRIVGLIGAAYDLTEGKLLEISLRKSELKYSLAESLAHIGHWERDFSGDRASWSPEIFRIFGIDSQGGAPGFRELMKLVHPQDRDYLQHEFNSIRFSVHKKKEPVLIEYRIIRRDGTQRFLSTTAQPVPSSDGRFVNLRGIVQDITDRRVLEKRIAAISKAERESLQRDLHDTVCQQLSGLAFLAEEIKQGLFTHPEQAAGDLEKIIEINQTALGQAKEVARGLTPLTEEPGALKNALREMARYVSLTYRIPCRLILPKEIFPLDSCTSTQLYLIAREAAVNAARHAQGRLIRITLSYYRGKTITVRVTDDGRGLDPDQSGNQGLGLETMKQRADLIGARLKIFVGKKGGTVVECLWKKEGS